MSTNISKEKRENLLNALERMKNKFSDDLSMINTINEIENALTEKKYGLVFEEHEENVDIQLKTQIPVFIEDKSKEIILDKHKKINFLLEGDNLHSLKLLEKTHKGAIDIIYIDPPYNTGKTDFIYDDTYIDEEHEFKHSKWLSFMEKRLSIAKNLLSKNGVICISIDYHEFSQLKLLCDEIFGEKNYRDSIIIRRGVKSVQAQFETIDSLSNGYESVLIYSRSRSKRFNKVYENIEEKDASWNNHWRGTDRPTMRYPLFGIKPESGQWRWGEKRSLKAIENYKRMVEDLEVKNKEINDINISEWYFNELENSGEDIDLLRLSSNGKPEHFIPPTSKKLLSNMWSDLKPNGNNQLKKYFNNKKVFDNPKSVDLIKRLIHFISDNKDITILDFFAGSGTTGEAVLELNKEDNGNRAFILCTNNQNKICEDITYVRLSKYIKGYVNAKGKEIKGIDNNLKYYKTNYINRFIKDEYSDIRQELTPYIEPLIQLENYIDIKSKDIIVIFSDEEAKEKITDENLRQAKKLYIGSDVLTTGAQEELISKYSINTVEIPEYYFSKELWESENDA